MKSTIRRVLTFAAMALAPWVAVAGEPNPFAIDWYSIDGGGGTSSGGGFSVSGGIGQPDAGEEQSGGPFSITGGFWAGVEIVQTPGAPQLRLTRDPASGAVTVYWPLPDAGFVLRESPTLGQAPTPWVDVPPGLIQSNVVIRYYTIANPVGKNFFKLFPVPPAAN